MMPSQWRADRRETAHASTIMFVLVVALLAGITRFVGIGDHPPDMDELYHIIVGRSWAEHGTLALGDGIYERAWLHSIGTGIIFKLFGASVTHGRASSAIADILLIVAVGLWIRSAGAPRGAWFTALLLCFNYESIKFAQNARFYSWHALLVWMFAIAVYAAVINAGAQRWRRSALWAVAALLFLTGAMQLQETTVVTVAGLGIWFLCWLVISGHVARILRSPVLTALIAIAVIAGIIVVRLFAWQTLIGLWHDYRTVSTWAADLQDKESFYLTEFSYGFGWLFGLYPVATLLAWRKYGQPALFSVIIFTFGLIVFSLGGMKGVRYVYCFVPFMLALWGFALDAMWPAAVRFLDAVFPARRTLPGMAFMGAVLAMAAAVAFMSCSNYKLTVMAAAHMLKTGSPDLRFKDPWSSEEVDWTPYLDRLRSITRGRLVIGTDATRMIYYLNGFDILLSRSDLSDLGDREFMWDRRIGKRDISTGRSLEQIVRCYPRGALLTSDPRWRSSVVTNDAADVIERDMRPVALPPELHLRVYQWDHEAGETAGCAAIYRLVGPPKA